MTYHCECAMYNLPHHFPDKGTIRIDQNFYQRLSLEAHKKMIQTLRKLAYGNSQNIVKPNGFL